MILSALLPMMAAAQTVKSPNGNVSLTFSLTDKGQPTYEMTYKGKQVVSPSHLGLELAKDKHASKGMEETDLMDGFKIKDTQTSTSTRHGDLCGARHQPSETTTTRWR